MNIKYLWNTMRWKIKAVYFPGDFLASDKPYYCLIALILPTIFSICLIIGIRPYYRPIVPSYSTTFSICLIIGIKFYYCPIASSYPTRFSICLIIGTKSYYCPIAPFYVVYRCKQNKPQINHTACIKLILGLSQSILQVILKGGILQPARGLHLWCCLILIGIDKQTFSAWIYYHFLCSFSRRLLLPITDFWSGNSIWMQMIILSTVICRRLRQLNAVLSIPVIYAVTNLLGGCLARRMIIAMLFQ